MVDRKELKIHKIDNMSRDQLEIRLQQLVQEHQIVLGQAEEVKEVEEVSPDQKDLENQLGQEIVEEALLDDEEDLSKVSASHQQEDDLPEE